jgi:hypothetical protein
MPDPAARVEAKPLAVVNGSTNHTAEGAGATASPWTPLATSREVFMVRSCLRHPGALTAALSVAALAACSPAPSTSSRTSEALEPGGSSHARTSAGPLAARRISSSTDLIGGLRAAGALGDYYLGNDQIRVIVQDIDHAAQFYIFGGNIIDADVVRATGEPGQDLLAEFFLDLNLTHTAEPFRIEVIEDGSDGQEARIRVTGTDFPWPILPGHDPVEPMPTLITQDYVLHPGEKFVTLETTVQNTGTRSIDLLKAELLLVGSSLSMSAQGVEPGNIVGKTKYLTMKGSQTVGASYAYVPDKGSMIIPFEDAAQTGALLDNTRLRPGQGHTWKRYFVVGDRDAASATDTIFAMKGEKTGTLAGTAVDPGGSPVVDATIVVVDADGKYVTQCLTRSDGSFHAEVPPGDVTLQVSAYGRASMTSSPYTVTVGRTTNAALTLAPQGRLAFQSVDAAGKACPVRATLSRVGGGTTYVPSYRGGETVAVVPGDYMVTLSRGPEYSIAQYNVTVPSDGTLVKVPAASPAVLNRVIDTTGWISGDFHLHQVNSTDSWTLLETRVTSLLAEGVEVGVPTDHDHVTDLGPTLSAMGLTGQLVTGVGDEVSIVDYGHFNYFPIAVDFDDTAAMRQVDGTQYWFSEENAPLSASELFMKMRENPVDTVIQINHPRSDSMGYFSMIGYDADTGRGIREPLATDFDAIEVKTDVFGDDSLLPDYFSLINQGLRVTAMGNSDAHRGLAENGYPRTYMRVANDTPQATTIQDVVSAIKGGHASVSSGVFVDLKAKAGTSSAGPGDTLTAAGNAVTLSAVLQCPAWTTMSHFMVYANGQPLGLVANGSGWEESSSGETTLPLAPVLSGGRYQQTLSIAVQPARDTYYLLVAWGDGALPLSGDPTLGYTSPVYVDVDGLGFNPPGLAAGVGAAPEAPRGYRPKYTECGDEAGE